MKSWPWSAIWAVVVAVAMFVLSAIRTEWRVGAVEQDTIETHESIQHLNGVREEQGKAILQIQGDVTAMQKDLADLTEESEKNQTFREKVQAEQLEHKYLLKEVLQKLEAKTP